MKPDINKHNADPVYIRSLIDAAGLNQTQAAKIIGVDARTMRRYCQIKGTVRCPYPIQFCLEALK
ncbi:MAG: hypothetical protein ACOYM1_11420 [Methylovulum sp.]